ncbi:ligase-associated DNA damage response DEXH box helicase [Stratiformator vulcanicus]|uniref:ligase-associated DNA damage response DEXH box helicase n=1 Tax=Stratiformator vulcanicus TaxID=2527980 RepID=UPI002877D94D|nr:ligase-associated DNA damage response DEXH box helicase [Stratiformator vulcanicus]
MRGWFGERGWKPFPFQRETWDAYLAGESGLVHATTGTGKTHAAWFGPLIEYLAESKRAKEEHTSPKRKRGTKAKELPLKVLWITPLRAISADTEQALRQPLDALAIPWTLETRTGDTSAAIRARQRKRLPTALITTPESLCLLLTRDDAEERFADLRCVIVDEWHELLSTKRGSQTELALARLRRWRPDLRIWGLSATLGNLDEAMAALLSQRGERLEVRGEGPDTNASLTSHHSPLTQPRQWLISATTRKVLAIETLIPETMERFPWAGHLGIRQLPMVIEAIERANSSILFTNTRSQTEIWYQSILKQRPDWAGLIALHHGSIAQQTRRWVEDGLRQGKLKCVVSTSSLDLGVDFSPVDCVLQVGSPKGVARLLQRAGRSGHSPGRPSKVVGVPTHALELVEFAACRDAIASGHIESRQALRKPLDVLVQHAVTIALGGGFRSDELLDEVRRTTGFADVTDAEWEWVLDFVTRGGEALRAYDEYRRVAHAEGEYRVDDKQVAKRHRMGIGTIASDAAIEVRYLKGGRIGTVEESFVSRMKPGDRFLFAGRVLELVKFFDMKAWVRVAKNKTGTVPRWSGGRMPLSNELSTAIREKLQQAKSGVYDCPEMQAVKPVLQLQADWSRIPARDELLIERTKTREGYHLFFYPFAGRLVHEGLAALCAFRLSQLDRITFTMAMNDYGFELLAAKEAPLERALEEGLFDPANLREDILDSLNGVEMAKRQFREIARVAGLVYVGYPGSGKTAKQLQASTGLLYDVFANYDPSNLLLRQARDEVLERQLEHSRMFETLQAIGRSRVVVENPRKPTPLGFPLMVDRLREKLSSEKLSARISRMSVALEKAAG